MLLIRKNKQYASFSLNWLFSKQSNVDIIHQLPSGSAICYSVIKHRSSKENYFLVGQEDFQKILATNFCKESGA